MVTRKDSGPVASRPPRATIKDVARLAGVGIKTVSRVVNEETGVSPALRRKVSAAIAELGYRRNDSARVLRQGTTNSIGLVCEDLGESFISLLIGAVENVAIHHSSILIVAATGGDVEREKSVVQALATRQVDGLIIAPTGCDQPYLKRELEAGMPIVFVDRPSQQHRVDAVLTDNVEGAAAAAEHLFEYGHRRIAFFGHSDELFTQVERIQGYRRALEAHGISYDPDLVCTSAAQTDNALAALRRMLGATDPVTAMITGNSVCTYAVLRSFALLGLQLPLVGFDDFSLSDLLHPGITVIEQSPANIGRVAAERLFARIAGDDSPPQTIRLGTELIARGSGEIPKS